MTNNPKAGLDETGLGRFTDTSMLDGVSTEAREEYTEESDLLARQMAALTVRRKCNTHACTKPQTGSCGHGDHEADVQAMTEILAMLGLPQDIYSPTPEERDNLFDHMPGNITMELRRTEDMMVPATKLTPRF